MLTLSAWNTLKGFHKTGPKRTLVVSAAQRHGQHHRPRATTSYPTYQLAPWIGLLLPLLLSMCRGKVEPVKAQAAVEVARDGTSYRMDGFTYGISTARSEVA